MLQRLKYAIVVFSKLNWYFYNLIVFLKNGLSIAQFNKFSIRGKLLLRIRGSLIAENDIKINSGYRFNPIGGSNITSIVVYEGGSIHIGKNVGISNSAIVCTNKIVIKDDVFIGGDCKIYDTDFHSIYFEDRILNGDIGAKSKPVYIGKGAFIGTGSTILKGVNIGDKSVIAAGSIVTKDIPSNEVWGGNPIKFLFRIEQS
jgi:acetyltransferase-like isoleucine patch superfamily enzyme